MGTQLDPTIDEPKLPEVKYVNGWPILYGGSEKVRKPKIIDGWPIMYEDDEEGDLGESNPHVVTDETLHICLKAHFRSRKGYQVFSNMNLYYERVLPQRLSRAPYVSPDNMIVVPYTRLPDDVASYWIGIDGPAPLATIEVLSKRSAQQRDRKEKGILYAKLGIAEYILVDVTGKYLAEKLLLRKLQPNKKWKDVRDPDGGVTSKLGFRLIVGEDGQLSVIDSETGQPYDRPAEALKEVRKLRDEVRQLKDALARAKSRPKKRRKLS
jgi:Uma2 family endonuclease